MKEVRDQQTRMQIHQLLARWMVVWFGCISFVLVLLKEELLRLLGNCKNRVC